MSRLIYGDSSEVKEMLRLIQRVAQAKTNILILGESGTGKELVARTIHDSGPFKNKPFVPVNCGAIPENLIESEMFGHQKGSFTGAISEKAGLFEVANQGTIFLDEIGELPLAMQVKLLRVIQERAFRRVGGLTDIHVDVRIIAATNRDLEQEVRKGKFREDLYYRLNVISIRTPPLRDRKGDIQLLAERFLKIFSERAKKSIEGFEREALAALNVYRWPGNVRELENVVERAVTLENGNRIGLSALPQSLQGSIVMNSRAGKGGNSQIGDSKKGIRLPSPDFSKGRINLDDVLGQVERIYLLAALQQVGGDKKKAADLLGITSRSMRYRLNKLGIPFSDQD